MTASDCRTRTTERYADSRDGHSTKQAAALWVGQMLVVGDGWFVGRFVSHLINYRAGVAFQDFGTVSS